MTREERNAWAREYKRRQNDPATRTIKITAKERRQMYVASGLCSWCGKPRDGATKQYCRECADKYNASIRKRHAKHKESKICSRCKQPNDSGTTFCRVCQHIQNKSSRIADAELKVTVFNKYGGAVCACCGEDHMLLLNIDHINNDGNEHRKAIKGQKLYRWLRANNYPPGYQVLCWNCNMGKHLNGGICPHKEHTS